MLGIDRYPTHQYKYGDGKCFMLEGHTNIIEAVSVKRMHKNHSYTSTHVLSDGGVASLTWAVEGPLQKCTCPFPI
jgi:hypothetical protein